MSSNKEIHEPQPLLVANAWSEYVAFQSALSQAIRHPAGIQLDAALWAINDVSPNALLCFQPEGLAPLQVSWLDFAAATGGVVGVRRVLTILKQFRARVRGTNLRVFARNAFARLFGASDLSIFSGMTCCRDINFDGFSDPAYVDLVVCAHECLSFIFESLSPAAPQPMLHPINTPFTTFPTYAARTVESPIYDVLAEAMFPSLVVATAATSPSQPLAPNPFNLVVFIWLVANHGIFTMFRSAITGECKEDLIDYVIRRQTIHPARVTREVLIRALLASGDLQWDSALMVDTAATLDAEDLSTLDKLKLALGVSIDSPCCSTSSSPTNSCLNMYM